jgi:hypothetical protein
MGKPIWSKSQAHSGSDTWTLDPSECLTIKLLSGSDPFQDLVQNFVFISNGLNLPAQMRS